MIDIAEALASLAAQRPVFHSEADFQHALAWEIHRQLPDASLRLELPFQVLDRPIHLDLWVTRRDTTLAFELKYRTRALSVQIGKEQFNLMNQAAQPIGRYGFLNDIRRLEHVVSTRKDLVAYAILLTNDSAYWTEQREGRAVDADFRLQEGRTVQGILSWGLGASAGTKRRREEPLELKGTYTLHWEDYSQLGTDSYPRFRYLAARVGT